MGDEDQDPAGGAPFTDADQLTTDVPGPVADPDVPPPTDTVDAPPAVPPAAESGWTAALAPALAGDAAALEALGRLARSGRLDAERGLGESLAGLAERRRTPELMLAGIDPKLILSQVVRHVDNPLRVAQGRGKGTCGAGTMEYLLLRALPAELVRLVDGITGLDQKATMRSGATLELPPTAIPRDDSGRVDVDRLLQSALMSRASTMSWIFDYDNRADHDDLWSEIQGNSAVPIGGFKSLYDDLTGDVHDILATAIAGAGAVVDGIAAALSRGERVPVLTGFLAPTKLHWLAMEKMDAGPTTAGKRWVYLRNPWGADDGKGPPPRFPLDDGGGRIGMEYAAFVGMLQGAVVKR